MVKEHLSRRRFIRQAGAAGAGLAGVALAGCTTTQITANPTTVTTAATTIAPVSGGTLYYTTPEWPDDVDWRTGGTNACAKGVWAHVGDALINFEPDFSSKGILIESWDYTSDYMTWTLNFREGVEFHNGAEMTTHDFEGWLKGITAAADYNGPTPFFQGRFTPKIKSWDVVDSYTINVNMKIPQYEFDRDLGNYPIYMAPYDNFMSTSKLTSLIGTGAWKFKEHVTRQYLTMEKNPDWWAAKAGLTKLDSFWYGTQYLDRVIVKYGAEEATKLISLQTGDTDVAQLTNVSTAEQAVADPNLDVVFGPQTRTMMLNCNIRNAPFTDVRAREMILKAIDWQGVLTVVARGLKPSVSMYTDSPYYHNDIMQHVAQYDPARAQSLYNALNAEGKLNRSIILVTSTGTDCDKAGEFMINSIKNVLPNLNITPRPVENVALQTFRKENIIYNPASPENHWDLITNNGIAGAQESALSPTTDAYSKNSGQVTGPNATAGCPTCTKGNFAGFSDPQAETLLSQAAIEPDLEIRKSLFAQIENIAMDSFAYRLYAQGGLWYGMRKKIHGFKTCSVFKKGGFNWLDVWKET